MHCIREIMVDYEQGLSMGDDLRLGLVAQATFAEHRGGLRFRRQL